MTFNPISALARITWLVSLLPVSLHAQQWHMDANEAFAHADSSAKPLLMVFSGSDWCKPCIKLDREVWQDSAFQQFADQSLVLLSVDFPRKKKHQLPDHVQTQNQQLAHDWNPNGQFPLVLMIDSNLQIIGQIGYQPGGAERYVATLQDMLQSHETQP